MGVRLLRRGMKSYPFHGTVLLAVLSFGTGLITACRESGVTDKKPAEVAIGVKTAPTTKIEGTWLRPDGGDRLVIGDIDKEGRAHGEYYNPRPINVTWTRVRTEDGEVKIDLELLENNSSGSRYKLAYSPSGDRLVGTYFQGQLQEKQDIEFVRQK